MIGGNKQFNVYRKVVTVNAIKERVRSYPADSPTYEDIWCRKVQRSPADRIEVQLGKAARPLVEEFVLIVPREVLLEIDDLAEQVDTGDTYQVLGVEDVSGMDRSWQCPVVGVKGLTKVPT